jgi:hypothetical protein
VNSVIALLLYSAVAVAGSGHGPPRSDDGGSIARRKADLRYPVCLRDRVELTSVRHPTVAFGRVCVFKPSAAAQWIELPLVDLDRSRAAWGQALAWERLNSHPRLGRPFWVARYIDVNGTPRRIPDGTGRAHLVVVWSSW